MNKHPSHEIPMRSKLDMLDDIVQIIHYLHTGERILADPLIDDPRREDSKRGVDIFRAGPISICL